ncbi:hypothetical protein E5288_WYG005124 [Bos mutus]|uniref:Uncharacterized protein n=1 Tax=Bos mutus TaxID=72004 RepID=A0A6B0S1A9_9CETA|nr:hypothetical protein [Bos mutus]
MCSDSGPLRTEAGPDLVWIEGVPKEHEIGKALVQGRDPGSWQGSGGFAPKEVVPTQCGSGNTQDITAPAFRTPNHDQAYTPINESDSVRRRTG